MLYDFVIFTYNVGTLKNRCDNILHADSLQNQCSIKDISRQLFTEPTWKIFHFFVKNTNLKICLFLFASLPPHLLSTSVASKPALNARRGKTFLY